VPDEGRIAICGVDPRTDPRAAREKTGAVLQATDLQDKITPREALDLFAAFYARPLKTDDLLNRFGLVEKAQAAFDTLSGGQKQRLALALACGNRKSSAGRADKGLIPRCAGGAGSYSGDERQRPRHPAT
jgi:ABC-2 type transport system ATP-binding protein